MTTAMTRSVMLTVLVHIFLVSYGAQCLEPEDAASLHLGALDLPWQDELCCDSPSAHHSVERGSTNTSGTNHSESNLPHRCSFRGSTAESHRHEPSGGTCWDIQCRIDENWAKLICDLQAHGQPLDAGLMVVSLQPLLSQEGHTDVSGPASDNPVVCEAKDSFMCTVTFDPTRTFVTMVTVSISNVMAPPVVLRVPAPPVKPNPPVHLSHVQTIEAELILHWEDPSDFDTSPLRYEVRYATSTTHPVWQVLSAAGEPRLALDLKPRLNYTIQARCSGLDEPSLWSEWSEPHHIYLDTVSYIPEKIVTRPGENVTVYCVFNDHSINASMAVWMLNFQQPLHHSQYHPVNQRVSQITVRPSRTEMYDLLRCTQEWTLPYSQIYVEGAFIDIKCETNGDINAMDCRWTNKQWIKLTLQSRLANVTCDEMEERERAGEEVGKIGPDCTPVRSRQKTCTIHPLWMNCYKLWLELPSQLGPIRSKPIYLSPIDHVKPHPPTNVRAVSQRSGVLMVTWEPPLLPAEGLQCQFRYFSLSSVGAQPEWKVQSPVLVPRAEVVVPDMCRVYVVQVRCKHINGIGYWSEWSESVYSTPQNSRAPERGPDFWRIRLEEPYRNQTNVTLLFENIPKSENSYCVDGFIVQYQASSGSMRREWIELLSSYSFEWMQDLLTVTVKAYNSLGSSTNNVNMTLDRQPKRRCVRSFHALVINSTCVCLSWSLLDNSSVPLFMVVQWSSQRQQDTEEPGLSGERWTRLPYTDHPVYLRGDFFDSEEYSFYLYPVFAEGEGEPVLTLATRGNPAVYMMLMTISFLSIVLFVTLVLSQNQMKKFVWKDVPNPKKCSWAKGLDFKKADTFDHLFRPPESLPAWPPLLPSEKVSKVMIVDKTAVIQTPLLSLTSDPVTAIAIPLSPGFDPKVNQFTESEAGPGGAPSLAIVLDALNTSSPRIDELHLVGPLEQDLSNTESSAQSSVTYATVLPSNSKQEQQPLHLQDKEGSGSSSSDEGNFSANNSDISGSFHGALWELDSCRGGDMDDPRRSCSYNSAEELSETSEQEDEGAVREKGDLYYLGMDYPAEDEESAEEETKTELLKNVLNREDCFVESHPLLGPKDSNKLLAESPSGFSPLYLPQFRTAPYVRQLAAQKQDSTPEL